MTQKYPKSEAIADASLANQEAYVFWGDDTTSRAEASKKSSEALEEYAGLNHAYGSGRRYSLDYSNLDGFIGGRPGLTRTDYDFFRPDEAVPRRSMKLILKRAEDIYHRVGLVKNVVDLMGDFAVQGIKLVHQNKRIERFYRQWFKKVHGKDRSERFLNNLYKTGNIVINRQTAKLSLKASEKLYKAVAVADMEVADLDQIKVEKRVIPWKYTFIDPAVVEVSAGPLSSFVHDRRYELVLPASLRKVINNPKTENE